MRPNLITFVGLDSQTDLKQLAKFSWNSEIELEFGFLLNESLAGKETRYTSREFIYKSLLGLSVLGVRTSLHLCSQELIDEFIDQDSDLEELLRFGRVQLNLKAEDTDLVDLVATLKFRGLDRRNTHVILQNSPSNQEFLMLLQDANVQYDLLNMPEEESQLIKSFPEPSPHFFTGFAGGLKPENVLTVANNIRWENGFSRPFFLSLEAGVRTNDLFDLEKCKAVVRSLVSKA